MGDRPPTGEPEKEKEEEREEKRRKKRKKKKKKNSSGRLGYWACSVRRALPRAGSARRVLRAAEGAGPGWRAGSGQTRRGSGGSAAAPWGDCARLPDPRVALSCRWLHLVSCTLGEPRLTGAGRGPPAARAAPRGEDANAATFGAVQPSPFCTRADGSDPGRRRALWPGGPAETQGAAPLLSPGRRMDERGTLIPALVGVGGG